ncbi:MAG: hypothetical protein NTZ46_11375 [Verrucomicrobia bacterium]|nr:hypothetical protein [Verrucomicrobiota bacterium]
MVEGHKPLKVADIERISRFLLFSRWFTRQTRRVKADAFIPHPRIELSVSCTEELSESEIWPLGEVVVMKRPDNVTLYGRADRKASSVRKQRLEVERNDNPPHHANITGWSSEGKDAQRMKAVEIAAASILILLDD